jgi:hypothetical protein
MKLAMVAGNMMIDDAKIGGITPELLILSGKWVLCPPYMRRPTTRLAYWTGIRRCPCSTKMMIPTTATMSTSSVITRKMPISPVDNSWKVWPMATGIRQTMPEKMMSEIPLPIPRSVICSPSHMMKAVPAVRVMTVNRRKLQPGWSTTAAPPGAVMVSRPTAMPKPWMMLSTTVP